MSSPRLLHLSRRLTTSLLSRSLSSSSSAASVSRFSLLRCLSTVRLPPSAVSPSTYRTFSTNHEQSSMNDNNPTWSDRAPQETISLDGCDFKHWLIVTDPPPEDWTRDQIIDFYIKTLAQVVGSEEEARMMIYSVSTKHYFSFGALISQELSDKLNELEKIRWVLPDSYLDVMNKDYGGEPFINGQAVPYDPKYHEEWVRNNQKANERNSRNDRPRNADRSRNFDRRQGTPQTLQNPPGGNMGGASNHPRGGPNNAGHGQNNVGYQQNNQRFTQDMPPANNVSGNYGGQGNPVPNHHAGGGMPYQNDTQMGGQEDYAQNKGYQSQNVPGRDMNY